MLPNKVAPHGLDHDLLRAAAPEMRFQQCKDFCSKEYSSFVEKLSSLRPLDGDVRGYLKLLWWLRWLRERTFEVDALGERSMVMIGCGCFVKIT